MMHRAQNQAAIPDDEGIGPSRRVQSLRSVASAYAFTATMKIRGNVSSTRPSDILG
jgi:hypothetical protein